MWPRSWSASCVVMRSQFMWRSDSCVGEEGRVADGGEGLILRGGHRPFWNPDSTPAHPTDRQNAGTRHPALHRCAAHPMYAHLHCFDTMWRLVVHLNHDLHLLSGQVGTAVCERPSLDDALVDAAPAGDRLLLHVRGEGRGPRGRRASWRASIRQRCVMCRVAARRGGGHFVGSGASPCIAQCFEQAPAQHGSAPPAALSLAGRKHACRPCPACTHTR